MNFKHLLLLFTLLGLMHISKSSESPNLFLRELQTTMESSIGITKEAEAAISADISNSICLDNDTRQQADFNINEESQAEIQKIENTSLDQLSPALNELSIARIQPIITLPILRCTGSCTFINIASLGSIPSMTWSSGVFTPSHGSPTVGAGGIGMWSSSGYGEGMNIAYNFKIGVEYCMSLIIKANKYGSNYPYAYANIMLTPNAVKGTLVSYGGGPTPPAPFPNQSIWHQDYNLLPATYSQYHVFNFIPNNNYNSIWFFPDSTKDYVNMNIRDISICAIDDPCNFSLRAFYYKYCNRVFFTPFVILPYYNSAQIVGYIWNFGDGNYSYDKYPTHFYNSPGNYLVELTVTLSNGRVCCTKRYYFKIKIEMCDPCTTLKLASIKITNMGSFAKFEPTIPHNPYYLYQWSFSDGTTYNTRDVYKTNFFGFVTLTITYAGNTGYNNCCFIKVSRHIFFSIIYNQIGFTKYSQLPIADSGTIASEDIARTSQDIFEAEGYNNPELNIISGEAKLDQANTNK